MTEKTVIVNLTLEESGTLYHMLLSRIVMEEKAQATSSIVTELCAEIRGRQVVLLKKLINANNELRR